MAAHGNRIFALSLFAGLVAWGCGADREVVSDGAGGESGVDRDAEPMLGDMEAGGQSMGGGPTPGGDPSPGGEGGHAGGTPSPGGRGGEGGHGGAGGEEPPPPAVDNCADACARYDSCGRLDRVDDDLEACFDLCESIPEARQETWFACLSRSACSGLGACSVPQPPPPGCLDLCGRAEACGAAVTGCESLCADADGAPALERCGADLNVGTCETDALVSCVLDQVEPACGVRCAAQAPCSGDALDVCARQCLAEVAAGDPLSRARLVEEAQCYAAVAAGDCDAVVSCASGPARFGNPPPMEAFCQQWSACQWDFEWDCFSVYDQLLVFGDHFAALFCLESHLNVCDDPYTASDSCLSFPLPDPRCEGLCAGVDACGLALGDGDDLCEAACAAGPGAEGGGRVEAQIDCISENTCEDLGACLEANSPASLCAALCEVADRCELPLGGDDCAADCESTLGQPREDLRRACIQDAADDCRSAADCALPPPVRCDVFCQRYIECGYEVTPACVSDCELAAYSNPAAYIPSIDCVIASATCEGWVGNVPSVAACYDEPWRGQLCSAFCRQGEACESGALQGSAECLTDCGAGLTGEDAIRLELGTDCLFAVEAYPTCEDIDRCVPANLEVDCAGLCGAANACDIGLGNCEQACAEDPLGRARSLGAQFCLNGSEVCEDVAGCLGLDGAGPAPVTQEAFCALWNGCAYDQIWGACEWAYTDSDAYRPGAAACIAAGMRERCEDPFTLYDECTFGDGSTPCDAYCEAQTICHPGEGRGQACRDTCLNPASQDDVARLAPVQACGSAFTCDAFDTCVAEQGPAAQCQRFCDALGGCGLADDAEACAAECDAQFPRARNTSWRSCVDEGPDDCVAIAACEPPAPPPCADACQRSVACGVEFDVDACTRNCEDAAFADSVATTLHVGCVLAAPGCAGQAESVEACHFDPGAGSLLCLSWCRLVDDCDPDSVRTVEACILDCALGFDPDEGRRLAAAAECILEAGPAAACRALRPCRVEPAAADCDALCESAPDCGIDVPSCLDACAADPDTLSGCLSEASRLHRQCGGVAACLGIVPPPAPAACTSYCGSAHACDGTQDEYLCEQACAEDGDNAAWAIRAACLEAAGCRRLENCVDLDDAIAPVCVAPCRDAQGCDAFESQDACETHCTGYIRSRAVPADYALQVGECLDDAGAPRACEADVARACFDHVQGSCETFCDDQISCQFWYFPGDEALCMNDCQFYTEQDPVFGALLLQCTAQFLAGQCDFNNFNNCVNGF